MDARDKAADRLNKTLWALFDEIATQRQRHALISRLLSSPEFNDLRSTWKAADQAVDAAGNRGLEHPDSDEVFVRVAYERLLGRPADVTGLTDFTAALAAGHSRVGILRALVLSEEFERRCAGIPRDTQLCELANPAKWDNEEWLEILRGLGLADDKLAMHRKPYEFAQLIYGCRRLGALHDNASVISVGAGHEGVLYWLANHVRRVVATDLYEGVWQDIQGREGDPNVLRNPEAYAPFPYRRDRLVFMRMDGRHLAFADGTFEMAYSLSSIEHFGGMAGATATLREMGRVLKPGGILALATEYVLEGPPHEETFRPHEFARLIDQPGLELVQPIDDGVYRRYTSTPIDLYKNPYQTPHMVVRFNDTVFTTVMVFLRKR
jgi:SAM-dependent methyltransferase